MFPPKHAVDPDGPDALIAAASSSPKCFTSRTIFLSLCIATFLAAVSTTAASTILPEITTDLRGGNVVWVGVAYSLACTATLPLGVGVAEVFGLRVGMFLALMSFILGSALCGSAQSANWLIAARIVQGIGAGGIQSISLMVVSNVMSPPEYGTYHGFLGLIWVIASAIGPVVGNVFVTGNEWRWLFYLNVPICSIALVLNYTLLDVPSSNGTWREKLSRVDWMGHFLMTSSTISVTIGLTRGGVQYPWDSPRVLLPLIIGCGGLAAFFTYETIGSRNPIVPFSLLQNLTEAGGYIQAFITPLVSLAVAYYLPVYYQAYKNVTPLESAIGMVGLTVGMGAAIVMASISATVLQLYRSQVWTGWALFMIGMLSIPSVRVDSSVVRSISWPFLVGAGAGIIYSVTYVPASTRLRIPENARFLSFFHSFASIWSIAISACILQNELFARLPAKFLEQLGSETDVIYAAISKVSTTAHPLNEEIRLAFGESLAVIWSVMFGMVIIGFLVGLGMRDVSALGKSEEKRHSALLS